MKHRKSFAQILAEVESMPTPAVQVCPGEYNTAGDLFDPVGNVLHKIGKVTPREARQHVKDGAQLAWEGCGCGGWSGCTPVWVGPDVRATLGDGPGPRLKGRHDIATWIDLWQGDEGLVVYIHGDVVWANALA